MKVELILTDDVASYIEYIPKDQLSNILSGLLVEAIKSKSSLQKASTEDINASSAAISEVMTLLKQMADNSGSSNKQMKKLDEKPQKKMPKKVITLDAAEADMDEDFLEMLR